MRHSDSAVADMLNSPGTGKTVTIVEAIKKLVELSVEGAKILDICVEGDKLIEQGTGAVYNKAVKGVKVPKGT